MTGTGVFSVWLSVEGPTVGGATAGRLCVTDAGVATGCAAVGVAGRGGAGIAVDGAGMLCVTGDCVAGPCEVVRGGLGVGGSSAPHIPQKRFVAGFSFPQLGQRTVSPHS